MTAGKARTLLFLRSCPWFRSKQLGGLTLLSVTARNNFSLIIVPCLPYFSVEGEKENPRINPYFPVDLPLISK